jgi:hypothetical protein
METWKNEFPTAMARTLGALSTAPDQYTTQLHRLTPHIKESICLITVKAAPWPIRGANGIIRGSPALVVTQRRPPSEPWPGESAARGRPTA